MNADSQRPRPDDGPSGCAKPSLPGWRTLGERVRQAALAATALHLIESEKGGSGSVSVKGGSSDVREAMLETSRSRSGG